MRIQSMPSRCGSGSGGGSFSGFFARAVHFLDITLLFPASAVFLGQLAVPAHFLRDFFLGFGRIAVFVLQLHVFVRARVAFLHELFVIVLVPFRFRVLLPALLRLDGLGELPHEIIHAGGGLFRARCSFSSGVIRHSGAEMLSS